jgi:hypothetical protein
MNVIGTLGASVLAGLAMGQVVNVNARWYGYAWPTDPAPVIGQVISPFSNAPDGRLNQLSLPAGTYTLTNAAGLPGADPNFVAWNYSGAWVWAVVICDDATRRVVLYAQAGGLRSSAAEIANDPAVRNVRGTFTLPNATTIDLMIRDYYLFDNAGGVAVLIERVCDADFNGDGFLDFFDYSDFVACFEGSGGAGCDADFNGDAFVDFFDYSDFVAAFEAGC